MCLLYNVLGVESSRTGNTAIVGYMGWGLQMWVAVLSCFWSSVRGVRRVPGVELDSQLAVEVTEDAQVHGLRNMCRLVQACIGHIDQ